MRIICRQAQDGVAPWLKREFLLGGLPIAVASTTDGQIWSLRLVNGDMAMTGNFDQCASFVSDLSGVEVVRIG